MIQRNTQSKNTIKECFFTHAFFSSVFFTVLWSPFCVHTSPHFVDISPLIFILLSVLLPFLFHSPLLVPPGFLLVHYNFPSLYKAAPSPLHLSPHLLCPPVPLSLASFTLPSSVPSALHPSIPLFPSPVYNARDLGSIPGLGRFPGEGNGNPLQYSCLESPMDGGAW